MDDATLLGYLLHALDPEAHRRVEAYLLSRPQAWGRVARLRRSLAALAEDEPPRPPPAPSARARTQPDDTPLLVFGPEGPPAGPWAFGAAVTAPAGPPERVNGMQDHSGQPILYAGGHVRWQPNTVGRDGVFFSAFVPP